MSKASQIRLATCKDIEVLTVPRFGDAGGSLTVFDRAGHVPFDIARVFVVHADAGQKRGRHAHRECIQLLNCPTGACEVVCDDGADRLTLRLGDNAQALLIPPGIWAEQTYLKPGTALMVLCSQSYSEVDYIRSYDEFLKFRAGG